MRLPYILLIACWFLFIHCEEENSPITNSKGDVYGTVYTTNGFGDRHDDNDSVKVVFERPGYTDSALTDTSGVYKIKDLPLGTYKVTFSKPLYETITSHDYTHVGKKDSLVGPWYRDYPKIPQFSVTLNNIEVEQTQEGNYISVTGEVIYDMSKGRPTVEFFVGASAEVSKNNHKSSHEAFIKVASEKQFDVQIPVRLNDYESGETIYIIAYPRNPRAYGYDPIKNERKRIGYGDSSSVISGIIP